MKKFHLFPAVIVSLLIACGPAPKQIETVKVEGQEVTYTADTLTMKGYLAYDANVTGKRPGVLVVHEWWGHNDYARQRAEMLAELGYVALAVDMFGNGKQAAHPQDAMKFTSEVFASIDGAKARFEAALNTLKQNELVDTTNVGAIGYCFGGSVVLSMANAGYDLKAVAAFHGGISLPIWPENGSLKASVLVCNGADDPFIKPEHVEHFKNKMDSAKADYKYIAYAGAIHSFTSKEADENGRKFNMPLAYNATADSASWAEMKGLFERKFK